MKIGIGNDHAAVEMKNIIVKHLLERKYEVINYGTDSTDPYDYPLAGEKVAMAVKNKEVDLGIAICGTGLGISISCNKVKGIRASCVADPTSARFTKAQNNANVICFGAKIVGPLIACDIVDAFLETEFRSDVERYVTRINQITEIEEKELL